MTKIDKILEKMRNNPKDWSISHLKAMADHHGITFRQGKGSHLSFSHTKWIDILTVPAHKPIKPVYVKKFVSLIDALQEEGT